MRLCLDPNYLACAKLVKQSTIAAPIIGGAMMGAGSTYGSHMLAGPHPFVDPVSSSAKAGLVGGGIGAGMYGLSKLPAWTVLPTALIGGGLALHSLSRQPQGNPTYPGRPQ